MTDQIFISYSKIDSDFAHKLANDLEVAGFKVWIDKSIGGGDIWRETIEKNLKAAGEVIIVVSPNSMASQWVQHEGSLAYGWGKQLFPILIEHVESLPPWLEEYQWIDFVDTSREIAFDSLVAVLTPPNPIQDLLDQQVNVYEQTGELIGESILQVIKEAQEALVINEQAKEIISKSQQAIEDRRKRDQQIIEELRLIDKQKSDFISIAAHELRTPLTLLSSYSSMLLDIAILKDNPLSSNLLNGISASVARLQEIVDSMLEVTKINVGVFELQLETFGLEQLLNNVCQDLSKKIQERNQVLELEDLGNLPLIQGDPSALEKAFRHLVVNAIKYTPDGGKITISGCCLDEEDEDFLSGGVEIIVSDTGVGIDPQFKELIFTKFFQSGELTLQSSTTTKFKGSGPGLGLAIVKGIVKEHGGKVWADSPGYDEINCPGSHFHVILPLKVDPQPNSNPEN